MQGFITSTRAIIILIAMIHICTAGSVRASEDIVIVERPDAEYLILGLEINGFYRSDGIEAYLPEESPPDDILIPLSALSEALSISIDVDPGEGTAKGFFLDEDKIFQLDMRQKQVISASNVFAIDQYSAESHFDDIYVKASEVEEWFNLDINLEFGTLTLYINSEDTFPFEASEERKTRAGRLLTTSRRKDFDPKEAYLIPYGLYSKPSILLQQSISGTKSRDNKIVQSTSSLQAGFDLLKFGGNLNLSYAKNNMRQSEITNARLIFSRSDPKLEMLGKLKAGRIDIGDVAFASVPLSIGGGQNGAGIRISSEADFGFRLSQKLGNISIDGDAPVNWDVEIYRNGQFIDFQTIGSNAMFEFKDIVLISGFNRFKILLFGPEGQKKSFTRDVFSGPNMLSEGTLRYNLATGMPQADFLPITEKPRKDGRLGSSGDFAYGINNFLTVGGSFFKGPVDDENDTTTAGLSASALFLGFNTQLQGMVADKQRTAIQAGVRKRIFESNVSLSHTVFNKFEEEDQDIKKSTEATISHNFGRLILTLIGRQEEFLEDESRTTIENVVSTELLGVKFTNQLTKTMSKNKQLEKTEGELSAFKDLMGTRIRAGLSYDLDPEAVDNLKNLRFSAQRKFDGFSSVRLISNYDFPSNALSSNVRYSRELGPVTLDFDLGGTTDETYFAGMTVRSSLQPSESTLGYDVLQPRIGSLANLGVRAFIDENANDLYDESEKTIKDVLFKTSLGQVEALTEENGVAWLYGLAETPTRIYVSEQDIPSIYLVPTKKGVDLIPRRGSRNVVDFPFVQLGEIDGFVISSSSGEPLGDVPVRIINMADGEELSEITSEYDGFYIFSALPLGEYKIIASQSWFDEENTDTDAKIVKITSEETSAFDVELTVDELVIDDLENEEEKLLGDPLKLTVNSDE